VTGPPVRRTPPLLAASLGFGIALVGLLCLGPSLAGGNPAGFVPAAIPTNTFLAANVSVDGQPSALANTASGAISVSVLTPVVFNFSWAGHGGKFALPAVFPVKTARLVFEYFGGPVFTKDQVSSSPFSTVTGSMASTVDLGQDRYLVEGDYLVQASILTANGSTVWTQNIYLKISAPHHLTAANLGLGGLVVAELYSVATIGSAKGGAAAAATAVRRGGG
jgi:hypothetical protein